MHKSKEYVITKIFERAFKKSSIKVIEFEEGSQLRLIDKKAFSHSSLREIVIPSHAEVIGESAFSKCEEIQSVEFEPNSELRIISKKAFYWSTLKKISIPSHVTCICDEAFDFRVKLKILKGIIEMHDVGCLSFDVSIVYCLFHVFSFCC